MIGTFFSRLPRLDHRSMNSRVRSLALITSLVIETDWTLKYLASHHMGNTLYNPAQPSLLLLAVLLPGCVFATLVLDRPSATIGSALSLGGVCANIFSRRLFGPVPDYIPEPFRAGWHCNLADISIVTGTVLLMFSLYVYLRDNRRARERVGDCELAPLSSRPQDGVASAAVAVL
jgi:lipoprotein signal peptidase